MLQAQSQSQPVNLEEAHTASTCHPPPMNPLIIPFLLPPEQHHHHHLRLQHSHRLTHHHLYPRRLSHHFSIKQLLHSPQDHLLLLPPVLLIHPPQHPPSYLPGDSQLRDRSSSHQSQHVPQWIHLLNLLQQQHNPSSSYLHHLCRHQLPSHWKFRHLILLPLYLPQRWDHHQLGHLQHHHHLFLHHH